MRQPKRTGQCGSATAELAMLVPAVLLLLGFLLFSGQAAVTQLRLEDAARAAARQAARGAAPDVVSSVARRLGGAEAGVSVTRQGELLTVEVSGRLIGPFGELLGGQFIARATAKVDDLETIGAVP